MYVRSLLPCPVLSPQSCAWLEAVHSAAFLQSSFQPCTSGQGHLRPGGWLPSSTPPWPSGPRAPCCPLLCLPWGGLGLSRAGSPRPALHLNGVRVCGQGTGKAGLMFQLLFLSGNPSLLCRGPRGTHCLPGWSQIPSEHYLPFPVTVPDLRVEDRITRGTGTSSWLLGCCGRREGAGEQLCRPGPLASCCSEARKLHHR